MRRYPRQFAGPTGLYASLDAIVKYQQARRPAGIRVVDMWLWQAPQNGLVDAHEEVAHIQLQVPSAALTIRGDLAHKALQAVHGTMRALTASTRMGVVYKDPLPIPLQVVHQYMANHPMVKIGGEGPPTHGARGKYPPCTPH